MQVCQEGLFVQLTHHFQALEHTALSVLAEAVSAVLADAPSSASVLLTSVHTCRTDDSQQHRSQQQQHSKHIVQEWVSCCAEGRQLLLLLVLQSSRAMCGHKQAANSPAS